MNTARGTNIPQAILEVAQRASGQPLENILESVREKLGEPKPYLAIKINIKEAFDFAGLVSRFDDRRPFRKLRPHQKSDLIEDLGILQRRRNQRVLENIERFVKIGAGVFGGHTGAEADPIERHGGIIDRSHPQTALS